MKEFVFNPYLSLIKKNIIDYNLSSKEKKYLREFYKCNKNKNFYYEFWEISLKGSYYFAQYIKFLKKINCLQFVLIEIWEYDKFPQSKKHHPEGNVYQHVINAMEKSNVDDIYITLSILFHDLGKINSYKFKIENNGVKHTYYGHDKIGLKIFEQICDRIEIPIKLKEIVNFCIENHMKFHRILEMKKSKIKKICENAYFYYLFEVSKADNLSRGDIFDKIYWDNLKNKLGL